jgi:hypothetical protein
MKRSALLCSLFVLTIAGSVYAAAPAIAVAHADGTVQKYAFNNDEGGAGCGAALGKALQQIHAGDVVQIPAVKACKVAGIRIQADHVKVVGKGPGLTILTPTEEGSAGDFNVIFQDMTVKTSYSTNGAAFYTGGPNQPRQEWKNVEIFPGPRVSGIWFNDGVSCLLDHVKIESSGYGVETNDSVTHCEMRDSTITSHADALFVDGGSEWNIYGTRLETTGTVPTLRVHDDKTVVNLYAGTSVNAGSGPAINSNGSVNLYPGASYTPGKCLPRENCHEQSTLPVAHTDTTGKP